VRPLGAIWRHRPARQTKGVQLKSDYETKRILRVAKDTLFFSDSIPCLLPKNSLFAYNNSLFHCVGNTWLKPWKFAGNSPSHFVPNGQKAGVSLYFSLLAGKMVANLNQALANGPPYVK
jgi:hypothetical protein